MTRLFSYRPKRRLTVAVCLRFPAPSSAAARRGCGILSHPCCTLNTMKRNHASVHLRSARLGAEKSAEGRR